MLGIGVGIIGSNAPSAPSGDATPDWAVGADAWYNWSEAKGTLDLPLTNGLNTYYGTGFGSQLAVGVTGFYQTFVLSGAASGVNGRFVAFSDGSSTNRALVLRLDGVYGLISGGILVSSVDTVANFTPATIVFAMGNGYQNIELIGGTPTFNSGAPWPSGMNMIGVNTNGWDTSADMSALPKKLALKFGTPDNTSFAAMRASAVLGMAT